MPAMINPTKLGNFKIFAKNPPKVAAIITKRRPSVISIDSVYP